MTTQKKIGIILPLAVLFVVLLFAMPRNAKLSYHYKTGQPWKYETLIAPFDFPILKTEEQLMSELSQNSTPAIPYYKYSGEVENSNLRAATAVDLKGYENMRIAILTALNDLYAKGIVGDDGVAAVSGQPSAVLYLQRGKRATTRPVTEVFKLSDARMALLARVSNEYPLVNVDSVLKINGIYDMVQPNLIYDRENSELMEAEKVKSVSPTQGFVSAGQLIVSRGEIVTPEISQMLDSYAKEYASNLNLSNHPGFLFWLGNSILALTLVVLIFLSIFFSNPEIFNHSNKYIFLLLVIGLFLLMGIIVPRLDSGLIYMLPFTLCALLLEPFFDNRLIFMVYSVALLPLLIFSESAVVVFGVFFVAGIVSTYTFRYFNKGWLQFVNAFITYAVMMVVYLGFRFVDVTGGGMLRISVYLFASAVLTVAGYPLTYLFERIFNLVSGTRLAELADSSNDLLQELEKKAPGTFQHSLQVMNMADTAARAVGANPQLVRVGALYHDIGKMRNPLCFVENESMVSGDTTPRYHSDLTPIQSAQEIIRHVGDGVEIASKHHLPEPVLDFIRTHHGNSHTAYFYNKFLNAGGDPSEAAEFQYPGPRPHTREQVILMLCDTLEAASRTLKEYTPKAFDDFVEKMVAVKTDEGQLDEAEISVKDLVKIKEVLKNYLSQMYHERIEYPKRKR